MKFLRYLFFFLNITVLLSQEMTMTTPLLRPRITVWIHGTRGQAFLPVELSRAVQELEEKFCSVPQGLNKVTEIDDYYYQKKLTYALAESSSDLFPLEHFFIFGWSGALNPLARKEAAQELAQSLQELVQVYSHRYDCTPHITLITHSHGGNVALQVPVFIEHEPFVIDQLILLACPVQVETASAAAHPMFKKIYVLFSKNDIMQILDPQKIHPFKNVITQAIQAGSWEPIKQAFEEAGKRPFFSKQMFPITKNLIHIPIIFDTSLPWPPDDKEPFEQFKKFVDKLKMIHIRFLLPSFVTTLGQILAHTDKQQASSEQELIPIAVPFLINLDQR